MSSDDLDLNSRNENNRGSNQKEVANFSLADDLKHFNESVSAIKMMFEDGDALIAGGRRFNVKNIWRAQIAFLASAFDFYMHELTRTCLCKIYDGEGQWSASEKFNDLQMSMKYVIQARDAKGEIGWLLDYIHEHDRYTSMISFKKVVEQLKLLGIDIERVAELASRKWNAMSDDPLVDLEDKLTMLHNRRNMIVHQTDRDSRDAEKKDVTRNEAERFITDVTCIVEAIDIVAREKEKK